MHDILFRLVCVQKVEGFPRKWRKLGLVPLIRKLFLSLLAQDCKKECQVDVSEQASSILNTFFIFWDYVCNLTFTLVLFIETNTCSTFFFPTSSIPTNNVIMSHYMPTGEVDNVRVWFCGWNGLVLYKTVSLLLL